MKKTRSTAIVLAAGQGKRMNSSVRKQYLLIKDKPVLYYSLKAFEESDIDDIVLVVGEGEEAQVQRDILDSYGFCKVRAVICGGRERYHSVAYGIRSISWECDYIFIHDGARPFLDQETIIRAFDGVRQSAACVVGMPVKDTIKIADENGFVESTPNRSRIWQIQTPQVFERQLIAAAYEKLLAGEKKILAEGIVITDDAMVVEYFMNRPVKLVPGSYKNIKITTPEDLKIAEALV